MYPPLIRFRYTTEMSHLNGVTMCYNQHFTLSSRVDDTFRVNVKLAGKLINSLRGTTDVNVELLQSANRVIRTGLAWDQSESEAIDRRVHVPGGHNKRKISNQGLIYNPAFPAIKTPNSHVRTRRTNPDPSV